ncbi:hypothetical protein KAW65_03415 [candidate division WOR-3 bacterium]|nr:hypothetical protein [candidate division WOR-3 bacterium]
MQRALTKVIKVEKTVNQKEKDSPACPSPSHFACRSGAGREIVKLRCRVRIKEAGASGFKLPKHMKGRVYQVTRKCVYPWLIAKGDDIILNPEEVKRRIKPSKFDINRDGYPEEILENEFLKVTILPHFGARIWSLVYKANGKDKFKPTLQYGKNEYVELGGADDHIEFEPPGKLWNAEFKTNKKGYYKYEKHGLKIVKHIKLIPGLPILQEIITIKSKKKNKIFFWHRIPINVSLKGHEPVVFIPTQEKLAHRRYHPALSPWPHHYKYYGIKLGAFIVLNEKTDENLLWITKPKSLDVLTILARPQLFIIAPYWVQKELKKGNQIKYSFLYILGEQCYSGPDTLAISSRAKIGDKVIFSLIARTERHIKLAKIYYSDKPETTHELPLPLVEHNFTGIGKLLVGKTTIDTEAKIKFKLELK